MTRFLERLAARSLEALPVLQPRRASRFEATDSSGAMEAATDTESGPISRPAEPSKLSQVEVGVLPRSGSPEAAGPARPRRETGGEISEAPSLPEPAPLNPDPGTTHLGKALLLIPAEPAIPLPPIHEPSSTSEPRTPQLLIERHIHEVQPLLVPSNASILPERPQQLRPDRTALSVPASMERREDIHISIGRIEIRAVPPPGAPTPRRYRDAGPSQLDSYLQQRSGRGTS